jgi:MbtH protein
LDAANPLTQHKPGWTTRIFGIETARLVACDARWTGQTWERGSSFHFLYRSRRGKFFELKSSEAWATLPEKEARTLWAQLPERLVTEADAFAHVEVPAIARSRDENEDNRPYKVVRNEKWEFSIWPDHKEIPAGWRFIGVSGLEHDCLEFIEQNCVFGTPNPGLLPD